MPQIIHEVLASQRYGWKVFNCGTYHGGRNNSNAIASLIVGWQTQVTSFQIHYLMETLGNTQVISKLIGMNVTIATLSVDPCAQIWVYKIVLHLQRIRASDRTCFCSARRC
jgi:hypothetical protein